MFHISDITENLSTVLLISISKHQKASALSSKRTTKGDTKSLIPVIRFTTREFVSTLHKYDLIRCQLITSYKPNVRARDVEPWQ